MPEFKCQLHSSLWVTPTMKLQLTSRNASGTSSDSQPKSSSMLKECDEVNGRATRVGPEPRLPEATITLVRARWGVAV